MTRLRSQLRSQLSGWRFPCRDCGEVGRLGEPCRCVDRVDPGARARWEAAHPDPQPDSHRTPDLASDPTSDLAPGQD